MRFRIRLRPQAIAYGAFRRKYLVHAAQAPKRRDDRPEPLREIPKVLPASGVLRGEILGELLPLLGREG
jgi:hypothetical protein